MLQPNNIKNKKIRILDSKLEKSDFIFIFISIVFSILISLTFLFLLSYWWVFGIFILICSITLIWGLPTNKNSLRRYKNTWYSIQYSFSQKEYNQNQVANFSPFQRIDENGAIIYDDTEWILVELQGKNIWKYSQEEIDRFVYKFNSFLFALKTPFKFLKLNLKNNYEKNNQKLKNVFESLNPEQQNSDLYKDYYINYAAELNHFENHFNSKRHSYFILVAVDNDYQSSLTSLKSALKLINFLNPEIVSKKEKILEFFDNLFFGRHQIEEENTKYVVDNLFINKDSVDFDNKRVIFSSLKEVPINISEFFIQAFFQNQHSNVLVDCSPYGAEHSTKMLDKAQDILEFEHFDSKSTVKRRSFELELQALDQYIEEFNRFDVSFINVSVFECIVLDKENKTEEQLKTQKDEILNILKARNERYKLEFNYWHLNQIKAFKEFFNLQNSFENSIVFSSLNLARTWPFTYEYFNDEDYFILASQSYSNGLIFFDDMKKTFTRPSSSMFFIGETGSGKTAAISKVALKHILKNDRVLFIDPNNDYSKITKKFNGQVVNLTDISKFQTNLLELKNDYYIDDDGITLHKNSNKSIIKKKIEFLKGLFTILNEQITAEELDFLSLLVRKTYTLAGFANEENDIETLKPITFEDVIKYADNLDIKELSTLNNNIYTQESLIKALRFLQNNFDKENGNYSYFNTDKVIDFNGNIISYNLQSILNSSKKEAEIICYILISNFNKAIIDNLFYNIQNYGWENQHKWRSIVIVVDEIHKFIGGAGGLYLVSFLFDAIKTLRKFWGLLIQGTQSFKDFALNENIKNLTKQLLEQTQYKFVLKISQEDIKFFDNMLPDSAKLLQSEKDYIANSTVGEAIFLPDSSNKQMIRFFYNDYEQKLIFRTKLQE
ncbi:hypothetical protein NPA08_04355 [Mycoplasmopsis citelli]|uniref:Type IV secretory pathway, VirB4 components n=1 Tax=Mycoplasmopsis citelli TaxID=171281 RepID=A0A449B2H5_9BACT|nr:hypothetical protein [Mycoplasmopsis citelli]UUD36152.1 hypothetical protein NPA08_04355 [Mycoplasmopsis citelli]VEU74798.1 Type IV secretory pathway, VirB4 components [Mycoplasmopsis citelli]